MSAAVTTAIVLSTCAGEKSESTTATGGPAPGEDQDVRSNATRKEQFPIILLPGFTGASLEARLDKRSLFPWCPKDTDGKWEVLWLDEKQFDPPQNALCFVENMKVNVEDGKLANHQGVHVRPRDFGGVDGMMYQDLQKKIPSFYVHFVKYMEKHGWEVGKTMFGAPYDWRFATERVDDYYERVQELIETVHDDTGLPVSIFAHSMGPAVANGFLARMTQEWKAKYIALFLALAPVWSGNIVSVWSAVSGLDCEAAWGHKCPAGQGSLTKAVMRDVADSLPASFFTFPTPGKGIDSHTWGAGEVIIKTKTKEYTAHNMPEMLLDLGLLKGHAINEIVSKELVAQFAAPLVDTKIFYGFGVATPSSFEYAEDFRPLFPGEEPPQESKIVRRNDDFGDGVVPLRSTLRANYSWWDQQKAAKKVLTHKGFKGMGHADTNKALPDIVEALEELKANPAYAARWQQRTSAASTVREL